LDQNCWYCCECACIDLCSCDDVITMCTEICINIFKTVAFVISSATQWLYSSSSLYNSVRLSLSCPDCYEFPGGKSGWTYDKGCSCLVVLICWCLSLLTSALVCTGWPQKNATHENVNNRHNFLCFLFKFGRSNFRFMHDIDTKFQRVRLDQQCFTSISKYFLNVPLYAPSKSESAL